MEVQEPRKDPQELETALEELRRAMSETGVSSDHLVPDLVAIGLAREVYENASAALCVSRSEVSRPLYPNARAAFEAAQDLVLLIVQEDYDEAGARAAATEILDRETSRELVQEVTTAMGGNDDIAPQDTNAHVEDIAGTWDKYARGKGDLVRDAVPRLRKLRKKGKYHWSGLSRSKIHKTLGAEMDALAGTSELYRSMYNLLSFETHPSPRIDAKHMKWDPDEGFTLFLEPDSAPGEGMGLAAALIAVETAKVVLGDIRAQRSDEK